MNLTALERPAIVVIMLDGAIIFIVLPGLSAGGLTMRSCIVADCRATHLILSGTIAPDYRSCGEMQPF
jgi:hypothetical protein